MNVTIELDKADLDAMHDTIFNVTGGVPSKSQIEAYWDKLPDSVKNDAILFGCSDTVFRDKLHEWLKENMEQLDLYYVLIKPSSIFVKEGDFFKNQGGLEKDWGKAWKPVKAESIEHARRIGEEIKNYG